MAVFDWSGLWADPVYREGSEQTLCIERVLYREGTVVIIHCTDSNSSREIIFELPLFVEYDCQVKLSSSYCGKALATFSMRANCSFRSRSFWGKSWYIRSSLSISEVMYALLQSAVFSFFVVCSYSPKSSYILSLLLILIPKYWDPPSLALAPVGQST